MRTTLTLDPDVAQSLKTCMARRHATLKEVVNEALRKGLSVEPERPRKTFRVVAHSFGFRPGIDTDKLGQLADELDTQAYAAKVTRSHKRR